MQAKLTCMRAEMCLQRFFPREDTIAVVAFNRGRRNRTLDHERRQCFGARPAALAFRLFGRPAATAGRVPGVRCALATVAPVPMPVRWATAGRRSGGGITGPVVVVVVVVVPGLLRLARNVQRSGAAGGDGLVRLPVRHRRCPDRWRSDAHRWWRSG